MKVYLVVSRENKHIYACYPLAAYTNEQEAQEVAARLDGTEYDEYSVRAVELDPPYLEANEP